ncbi:DUF6192 family protein [Streptomyces europaeiscabiei]|uniref:DUF6192 family protein n=1 Tax=Streptomyces europaeiscabiei TaxID=146819 RepID=UPI002E2A689B|nr:DUF6192 family protein [Streptomyces europaeiscabiei]
MAKKVVGWKTEEIQVPVAAQEKGEAIRELARDDEVVAAQVATDFLRRPDIAFKAMRDGEDREKVNEAQFEQAGLHAPVHCGPPHRGDRGNRHRRGPRRRRPGSGHRRSPRPGHPTQPPGGSAGPLVLDAEARARRLARALAPRPVRERRAAIAAVGA